MSVYDANIAELTGQQDLLSSLSGSVTLVNNPTIAPDAPEVVNAIKEQRGR